MPPSGWTAQRAIARCDVQALKQAAWRGHRRRYAALDHGGSVLLSGRFHQAIDAFPANACWPVLYLALDLGVEGMLVPSATGLGDNLIVFSDLIRPGSVLVEVRSIDPNLIKAPKP